MGGAMIKGWTKGRKPTVSPKALLIVDPAMGPDIQPILDQGAQHASRLDVVNAGADYVLMAIKPQSFAAIGPEAAMCLPDGCVVISIMAGITLDRMQQTFPNQHCVRAMPNTPASIGQGITGYVCQDGLSSDQKKHIAQLLKAGGEAVELDNEHLIDAVTAVSGSGPAYFFHMVEALAAAGTTIGLSEDQAYKFAHQTLIGAGALLQKSGQTASELRRAVTSPNGTTQAALDVLMTEHGLPHVLRDAVAAAYHRSQELGKDDA